MKKQCRRLQRRAFARQPKPKTLRHEAQIDPCSSELSSERFASSPSTLHQFEKYSEGVSDFEDGENAQTIRRALAVVENIRDGSSLDDAIADAWRTFPLVTR